MSVARRECPRHSLVGSCCRLRSAGWLVVCCVACCQSARSRTGKRRVRLCRSLATSPSTPCSPFQSVIIVHLMLSVFQLGRPRLLVGRFLVRGLAVCFDFCVISHLWVFVRKKNCGEAASGAMRPTSSLAPLFQAHEPRVLLLPLHSPCVLSVSLVSPPLFSQSLPLRCVS